jgi:tripartite-type tricarboxylate transporter receptor subunit TctC
VRALGTTGSKRAPAEPELPTIAEAGVPGYVVDSWQGVFAPKNTPPDIVKRMSDDIVAALADPATAEQLARSAYAARGSSPEELRNFLKADAAKWNTVIKTAGLKIN